MKFKVFKFGGASVKDADSFRNVGQILEKYKGEKIIIVVSATGKTTDALEKVVHAYFNKTGDAVSLLDNVKKSHYQIIDALFKTDDLTIRDAINDTFVEIDWILEDEVQDEYDYLYDQIVSVGEMLSSRILGFYLQHLGFNASFLDIRDVLLTDNTFREASVNFPATEIKMKDQIPKLMERTDFIVTQGFIGSTTENFTTTLGREGSDYTGGIISYCLEAQEMHIWKDVPGVLTADPSLFEDVTKIEKLSYNEAIEMAYYGAKVIHPKTIKPLQNKSIPLFVRPFEMPDSNGTMISQKGSFSYPPMIVIESNQSLLKISTNDFSFVAEHHLSEIFHLFKEYRIKVNMMQNTAISFSVSTNTDEEKIQKFITTLGENFTVIAEHNLELITIRHYNESVVEAMKKAKQVFFEGRFSNTIQMVVKTIS